jgi:adenine-specific DNA-methyltransferase
VSGLPSVIEGIDADPAGVWLANVILAAEALPLMAAIPAERRRPIPALAQVGDGLLPTSRSARAVVMNPPYGRVRLDARERKRFANVVYGHANLYCLFLGAGLEALEEHGVLSALVPTSFTAGRYFANLRAHLAEAAPLRRATFVVDRDGVFEDVLQETCLATFTCTRPRHTTVASLNGQLAPVATVKSPRGAGPWLLPRRSEDADVAAAAACMPLTLASAGWRVSTGPLVWNRRRDDLSAHPGDGRVPIVWAADIDGGHLHQDRARDPMRYMRLHSADDRAVMELHEPVVLVQRTTATEQPRRIVAVELTPEDVAAWGGSVVVENHVNVIRSRSRSPLVSRSCLARVLATATMDRLVRCFSGSVALSAYELEALPLPDVNVLATWERLASADLEAAVAAAYRPEAR